MSSLVFPTLAGLGWEVDRAPAWQNERQKAFSGAETSIAYWSYPKWTWTLLFNVLREGTFGMPATAYTEFSQLAGFYNQLYGDFDSFLYTDANDNSVTDQVLGLGDGIDTTFQLVRTFGNFVEPIFAPNVVTNVKDNGVTVNPANYSVSVWGAAAPGIVTFNTPPAAGHTITATYSYYFPCRFDISTLTFKNFMANLFSAGGVTFSSIKIGA